jgi:hypothetical protein
MSRFARQIGDPAKVVCTDPLGRTRITTLIEGPGGTPLPLLEVDNMFLGQFGLERGAIEAGNALGVMVLLKDTTPAAPVALMVNLPPENARRLGQRMIELADMIEAAAAEAATAALAKAAGKGGAA